MTQKTVTLAELAAHTQSRLIGNPQHLIQNVADLERASSSDASFLANPRYENVMQSSHAGVVFVSPAVPVNPNRNFLINENPSKAFQQALELLRGDTERFSGFLGVHPTAVIHETCRLGQGVTIGPYAVLDAEVVVGDNSFIGSGCYVGPGTTIGEDCVIHPRVTIREHCTLGDRVIVQPGAVIGSCGFGYLTNQKGEHAKLKQLGTVTLHNDVEIGANTTIDRARFGTTEIGQGTKLDNLIQIGHGVQMGKNNIFAAQSAIAGSTKMGDCVMAGGQVGIAGHLEIGKNVILMARTGVTKSLREPGEYGGNPAMPRHQYNRMNVYLRQIETVIATLKGLRKPPVSPGEEEDLLSPFSD